MPILVTCACGKKFRADEKHAGKQRSCPKCGQLLDIAGPQVSAYDVFVSYSNKDKTTCDALCATFERKGIRCWIAPRDILPGANWGEAIIRGIEQCQVMVLVFSSHSNESLQVKREVERAVSKGIPVIPLRIEDVKLSRAMEYFISSQHWLDALTPPLENHLEELARKVIRLLTDDGSTSSAPSVSGSDPMSKSQPTSLPSFDAPPVAGPPVTLTGPMGQTPSNPSSASRRAIWWSRIPLYWRWISFGGVAALLAIIVFSLRITPETKDSPEGIPEATSSRPRPNEGISALALKAPFSKTEVIAARAAWATEKGVHTEFTNEVGIKLVLIPPGQFVMGSPESEEGRKDDESKHTVTISQPYFMSVTEVTQKQWMAVMGTEPWIGEDSVKTGDDYPATYVTWQDALAFCQKLSQRDGKAYVLPTEAEWEYACRGGTETAYSFGADESNLGDYAWYDKNALEVRQKYAHQVGQKLPNGFGLHDMYGNVWEWCQDWRGSDFYKSSPSVDPHGPANGSSRVLRGASWGGSLSKCRSAYRHYDDPTARFSGIGFRLVRELRSDTSVVLDAAATPNTPSSKEGKSAVALIAPFSASEASTERVLWASAKGVEPEFTNEFGMALVLIPPGEFEMGSPVWEALGLAGEKLHTVKISLPYFLGVTEVTQQQWKEVMGTEPWKGAEYVMEGNEYPATYVSWESAVEFCRKLSEREGKKYRLPTEAEWEYACRSGTETAYSFGDDDSQLGDYAWYAKNARVVGEQYAHQVGQKLPNGFGLHDMHGNMWEWCRDWYGKDYYDNSPSVDPTGPTDGSRCVLRGGSWRHLSYNCRSATRNGDNPTLGLHYGVRVLVEVH